MKLYPTDSLGYTVYVVKEVTTAKNLQFCHTGFFESSSNHTYNHILWNIRMKTIIFKKIGQTQTHTMTCTTKGKET